MTYAIVVVPLSEDDGGGFLGYVPDLPGCTSDGETRPEAIANAERAILDWADENERLGREMPEVGSSMARFVDGIKSQFKKKIDEIAGRLEMAEADIEELREILENIESRGRFEALMAIRASGDYAAAPRCQ